MDRRVLEGTREGEIPHETDLIGSGRERPEKAQPKQVEELTPASDDSEKSDGQKRGFLAKLRD